MAGELLLEGGVSEPQADKGALHTWELLRTDFLSAVLLNMPRTAGILSVTKLLCAALRLTAGQAFLSTAIRSLQYGNLLL